MKKGRKSAWITKIEPRLLEIAALCRDGHVEKDICKYLGIGISTFTKYKALKPALMASLKINKAVADLTVENSLYKRAVGFEYDEMTHEIKEDKDGNKISSVKKKVKKIVLPDTTAQIFWLKNRVREKWKDRWISDEQQQPMIFNVNLGKKKNG